MSEILQKTDVSTKSKRLERISGKLPSKLRFTSATKLSFSKNLDGKIIVKAFNRINTQYSEMINAALIAEKAKAEEEARRNLSGNTELEKRIEEDDLISKMTSAEVVIPRAKKVLVELLKLEGRIGTYKNNFGINVKKGFAQKPPKALNVQKRNASVYKNILGKIDLYKIAVKKGIDVKDGEATTVEPNVPSWVKLFNNVSSTPANVTVAMSKPKDEEETEVIVNTSSNKLSEEDLSYRKMLGQLGDEFELIESYEKSVNGVPLQFKDGFESRKNNLSKIFFDLTGIDSTKKNKIDYSLRDNTEFQNLIDEVNGYKEPLSDEEHKKMEDSLNEYYGREEVSTKINELNEKDVLFTFNQHMDDVIKAELKQNNEEAVATVTKSEEDAVINETKREEDKVLNELKRGADEQARMLKTLYDYIDTRDKFEEEKREEERKMQQLILESAEVEAQRINDLNMIADSAVIEAQRIYNGQKEEADKALMDKMIKDSADIEAQNIIVQAQKEEDNEKTLEMIKDSANVEAQNIIENEQKAIENEKTLEMIKESAEVEAQRINDVNIIINGAEEQARLINQQEKDEINKMIVEGAEAEAHLIVDKELIANGIEEQVQQLQRNNEYADILESAEIQAKILNKRDKKAQLLADAKALAEKLKSINEEASKIDDSIAQYVDQDELNDYIKNSKEENSVKEEPKQENKSTIIKMDDAYFDTEIINSAEEEARRIYDNNLIADSAEVEAKRIYEKNLIADSVEEEAKRIYEKNLIADSIEEEARRIYDNNLIADSAEKEARRLLETSKEEVQEPVVQEVSPAPAPVVETPAPVVTVNKGSNYEIINIMDRYAELAAKSNPLLVTVARVDNITKRVNKDNNMEPINKKKEVLQTLKEELETGNYSFLKRSEDVEDLVPSVKAA